MIGITQAIRVISLLACWFRGQVKVFNSVEQSCFLVEAIFLWALSLKTSRAQSFLLRSKNSVNDLLGITVRRATLISMPWLSGLCILAVGEDRNQKPLLYLGCCEMSALIKNNAVWSVKMVDQAYSEPMDSGADRSMDTEGK